jgi:hypothetical protein
MSMPMMGTCAEENHQPRSGRGGVDGADAQSSGSWFGVVTTSSFFVLGL